jgi:hypothetical protein
MTLIPTPNTAHQGQGFQDRGTLEEICPLFRLNPSCSGFKASLFTCRSRLGKGQLMCYSSRAIPCSQLPLRCLHFKETQAAHLGRERIYSFGRRLQEHLHFLQEAILDPLQFLVRITGHSLNNHLLRAFHVPGAKVDTIDTKIQGQSLPPRSLQSSRETDHKLGK